jgi:hypothetical protein
VPIYRRRRERFADGCVKETDRFGDGSVIALGGIRTRLPISCHKCSMGFKSGDNAGQGRVRMWLSLRKFMATREIWHLALSTVIYVFRVLRFVALSYS